MKKRSLIKQLSFVAIDGEVNRIQDLLNKFKLWKVIRVVAWIRRFINNCRSKLRRSNSLVTQEAEKCLVKISQNAKMLTMRIFQNDLDLRLTRKEYFISEDGSRGRVYIPTNSKLARLIIEDAHERTLHGGVGRASLTFDQLKEVLMDVEVQLNNRPLGYIWRTISSLYHLHRTL
jgi:hypothetical protein